ncbi:hypothetical protein EAG_00602, partial [Camponotus floridanus]
KDVAIDDVKIEALIDTGSDISLMRADEYISIGSPRFQETKIRFSGIGSDEIAALGEFQAHITIDGRSYPILIRVVSDTVLRQKLIIGTDFLDTVEVNVRQGTITINPIRKQIVEEDILEIFRIDVEGTYDSNEVDVSHIQNAEHRRTIVTLVENYKPNRTRETDIKMSIVLKDDEP